MSQTKRQKKEPPARPVIQRFRIVEEIVEVPEGYLICSRCKGKGMSSKYDEGIKSRVHDSALAAKVECRSCEGKGFVPKFEP